MSATRKRYIARLVGRCAILLGCLILCVKDPVAFSVLNGRNFFREFSVLHLLWLVWMGDMLL